MKGALQKNPAEREVAQPKSYFMSIYSLVKSSISSMILS